MAASDLRVAKQAIQQLRKANSWVAPGLELEGMDEELADRWETIVSDAMDALSSFVEEDAPCP